MKKKKLHISLTFVSVVLVLLGVFLYYQTLRSYRKAVTETPKSPTGVIGKRYYSELLNISIEVPYTYSLEEKYTDIILTRNNTQINISRVGTNFENINDYLDDLSIKNSYSYEEKQEYKRDNLHIVSALVHGDKVIFIYINNWVYTISTSSPELYEDLDHIAKSFEYLGETTE